MYSMELENIKDIESLVEFSFARSDCTVGCYLFIRCGCKAEGGGSHFELSDFKGNMF